MIVRPENIQPDNAVPFMGRVVATLEGSNDVAAGELVYLSSATFGGRGDAIPRRLKCKRASATSVGRRLVAVNSGAVGDTLTLAPMAIIQMDTSAGAEGDPVYTTAAGVPTLTPAANGAVGFVLGTAATVANGGAAVLCPGLYIEGGIPAADIDITDAGTYFTTDNVEAALQELGLFRAVLALTTNGNGASLIGIEDATASLAAANVEAALAELATPLSLTAAAEAGNAIAVTIAGPAQVAQYKASLYDADGLLGVVAAWRLAETGTGAEVSATAKPTLFFTTSAAGAAVITVTDVSAAHAGTVFLLIEPASVQAGAKAGAAAMLPITFA